MKAFRCLGRWVKPVSPKTQTLLSQEGHGKVSPSKGIITPGRIGEAQLVQADVNTVGRERSVS